MWSKESRELRDGTSIMTAREIAGGRPSILSRVEFAGSLLEENPRNQESS